MLPAGNLELGFQATGRQHLRYIIPQAVTQSSVSEDGRVQHLKHIELTEFVKKPLLLQLVGVYVIYVI